MATIRVFSLKRKNPKTGEMEYSRYFRTAENIERMGAEKINNWYGVTEDMLDSEGKVLATTIHKLMNPPSGIIKAEKPTVETLKALKEVIPASELARQAEEKEKADRAFLEAVQEQLREDRGKQQGAPVLKTTRDRD